MIINLIVLGILLFFVFLFFRVASPHSQDKDALILAKL